MFDQSGRDGVNADAELADLPRKRAGHADECRFGSYVVEKIRRAPVSSRRRDIDDLAALLLFHLLENRLGAQKRPFDVDRRNAVPFLRGNLIKRMALDIDKDRRVVDQNIDATELLDRFGGHAVRVLFTRHINLERQRLPALRSDLLGDALAVQDIRDDYRRTLGGKFTRVGRADIAGAPPP